MIMDIIVLKLVQKGETKLIIIICMRIIELIRDGAEGTLTRQSIIIISFGP